MLIRWEVLAVVLVVAGWIARRRRRGRRWAAWLRGVLSLLLIAACVWVWIVSDVSYKSRKRRPPTVHVTLCYANADHFPATAGGFAAMLKEGLGRQIALSAGRTPVTLVGKYPQLDELRLDLTDALIGKDYDIPRSTNTAATEEEITAARLTVTGQPLIYMAGRMQATMTARDVRLGIEYDTKHRKPLLMLTGVSDGQLQVSMPSTQIDAILRDMAREEMDKKGIVIDSLRVKLTASAARSLDVAIDFKAHKNLLLVKPSASVKMTGKLDIDDQLVARMHSLKVEGGNWLGSLVGTMAEPFMRRYEGYEMPLNVLTGGDMKVQDVRIDVVDDVLEVRARFGL